MADDDEDRHERCDREERKWIGPPGGTRGGQRDVTRQRRGGDDAGQTHIAQRRCEQQPGQQSRQRRQCEIRPDPEQHAETRGHALAPPEAEIDGINVAEDRRDADEQPLPCGDRRKIHVADPAEVRAGGQHGGRAFEEVQEETKQAPEATGGPSEVGGPDVAAADFADVQAAHQTQQPGERNRADQIRAEHETPPEGVGHGNMVANVGCRMWDVGCKLRAVV